MPKVQEQKTGDRGGASCKAPNERAGSALLYPTHAMKIRRSGSHGWGNGIFCARK